MAMRCRSEPRRSPRAFSLVELVAVIVILAVLAAVAVPRYTNYREQALATVVARNLKLFSSACHAYRRDHGAWPLWPSSGSYSSSLDQYIEPGTLQLQIPGFLWFDGSATGASPPYIGLYQMSAQRSFIERIDAIADNSDLDTGNFLGGDIGPGIVWAEFYVY